MPEPTHDPPADAPTYGLDLLCCHQLIEQAVHFTVRIVEPATTKGLRVILRTSLSGEMALVAANFHGFGVAGKGHDHLGD